MTLEERYIRRERYVRSCILRTDINEHLPVLYAYAKQCEHITEFGVRGGESTTAFLYAQPKTLVSFDIAYCSVVVELMALKGSTDFTFIQADTTTLRKDLLDPTDLLFIDTEHNAEVLEKELRLSELVRKFIILHDTVTAGFVGDPNHKPGLLFALIPFLKENPTWRVKEHRTNNHGLTVLERVQV